MKTKVTNKDFYNAEHPLRKKAIYIMEFIADTLHKDIFACKKGQPIWYNIEDGIVHILKRKD
jgi:hypothetical protein